MNVLTGKVPGVEFVINGAAKNPVLSLLADFNGQLIIERIKTLKMQEGYQETSSDYEND